MENPCKKILVLGSGLMTESLVTALLRNPNHKVHIASNIVEDAQKLAEKKGLDRCSFSEVDVQNSASLKPLVQNCDIAISYIPAFLHHHVGKICIEVGRNLVTASYISKDMKDLEEQVKQKGLIFLNELGLDPGIDHLATMKIVEEVHEKGGKILEYESWCGGLPAPSCCDNPLGYKFTWSPIGAFRALKNNAVYIDNKQKVQIPGKELLYKSSTIELNNALSLQGYPNRDSVSYKDVYGLKDATKVLRGTLRYNGFCDLINAFKEIGYFDESAFQGQTWLEYTSKLLQNQKGNSLEEKVLNRTVNNVKHYDNLSEQQKQKFSKKLLSNLKYFGCTQPVKIADQKLNNLQNLVELLKPKLNLKPGETDLIAMQHRFIIEIDGKKFLRRSTLIEIGEKNGFTGMSVTVATPTAIGAELILEGKVKEKGVIRPIAKEVYDPVLERLEKAGIRLVEDEEEL